MNEFVVDSFFLVIYQEFYAPTVILLPSDWLL